MPNYCSYSMCVKGTKENVEEFTKVIQADYNYGTMEFRHDRHFFRVFEADVDSFMETEDGTWEAIYSGQCAWSLHTCMFEHGYYNDFKERFKENCFRGTTLPTESERLNLTIEAFSEESGNCFQEHFIVRDGVITTDDCVDFIEYDLSEFKTKEEAEKEYKIKIEDWEWENETWISRGGFGNWKFEI